MESGAFISLVQTYGLWLVVPIALVEGPIIAVLSGYAAKTGLLPVGKTYLCLVAADLAGDLALYLVGLHLRHRLASPIFQKVGLRRKTLARGLKALRSQGGRYLVVAKLTHSAGFAVLLAAGMARMPVGQFLGYNLAATLPKAAVFFAIGWVFGEVSARFQSWLWIIGFGAVLLILGVCCLRSRNQAKRLV